MRIVKALLISMATVLCMCSHSADSPKAITLCRDGQPTATLVLSATATPQAEEAAQALQTYIARMSGATLPIAREYDRIVGSRIFVGTGKSVQDLGINVPGGVTYQMNEEGFVMKTIGEDLILAGNEDWKYQGTTYAVFHLLEQLGCRWYFPGAFGEVIPSKATLTVPPMDVVSRPDFRFRNLWYAGWMPAEALDQERLRVWYQRNKLMSLSMSLPGDGSISQLAPADTYFESHPHLYALGEDGERHKEMLCMTEPEAVRIGVETITTYFRENPNAYTFGFAPPDGYPRCYCERCTAALPGFMGKGYGDPSLSDLWFRFANAVATEVYKKFPERWVLTNGYSNRVRLPESIREFSPNLGIQSAIIQACSIHRIGDPHCWQRQSYQQILRRWTDKLDFVFVYDYDPGKAVDNLPFPALHNLRHDMPYFKERGLAGFWTEGSNSWMVTHLNYYVRAKLMWDVETDVDALVRDYCEQFYGLAAKPIEQYIWTLEDAVESTSIHTTWGRLIPWQTILSPVQDRLERLITKAESRVDSPVHAKRVNIMRQVHDHMMAYVAMEKALDAADWREAIASIDRMLALRDAVSSVEPGLLPNTPDWAKDFRSTMEWHRNLYTGLAAKADGAEGDLIGVLPREWSFQKDPKDMGVIYQWYLPENTEGWEPIDTTRYWEAQGHADETGWGYWGKAWYRTAFDVPKDRADDTVMLTIGAAYNGADHDRGIWVWVNGRLVDWEMDRHHRLGYHDVRTPIHVDITADMRPGEENTVAVLIHTNTPGRNPRGGLHGRSFLWTPKTP